MGKSALLVSILALSAAFVTAKPVERVAALDFGAMDTVVALGDAPKIVAAPTNNAPNYLLPVFKSATIVNAGGLKAPDMAALKQAKPDFIVISGRANQYYDELNGMAPTLKYSADAKNYWHSVKSNILTVAAKLEKTDEANRQLQALEQKLQNIQTQTRQSKQKALVLLHNDGKLMLSDKSAYASVVFGLAGVKNAHVRETDERVVVDAAFLKKANPDVIFIVDRSAAIGNAALTKEYWQDKAFSKIKAVKKQQVVTLDSSLWYLSGGGLQSLNLQLDEVAKNIH